MAEEISGSEIKESLNLIQQAILALDKKIETQNKRIERLEQSSLGIASTEVGSREHVETPPAPPRPLYGESIEVAAMRAQQKNEAIAFESPTAISEGTLEENIGGKWFARIGLTALVLGVSFFLKYAFDNDWIGETGRVMIGILVGLVLLALGEKTIRKYVMYGQMLAGGGIAVLYLAIFSAFNFYHLIGSFTAFFMMIVITVVGIALSVRYDAISLMLVATLGGFATPILASSGENNQVGLLSYLILLDVAVLVTAIFKKWHWVNSVAFVGTAILFSAWGERYYTRADLGTTMFFLTMFFLVFSISSLIYNLVKKERSTGTEQLLTLFTAIAYFATSYALLNPDYHIFMSFFALILAIYYFLWAYLVRNLTQEDENLYGFLAFLTVGFVTLTIPIQFKQNIITIGWAIEAVLLMLIGTKLKKAPIVLFAGVVAALTLGRYFLLDIRGYNADTFFLLNKVFFTATMLVAAFYLLAGIIKSFAEETIAGFSRKSLLTLFVVIANLVTIFAVSQEIGQSYERQVQEIYTQQSKRLQNARNLPYGVSSGSYGDKSYQTEYAEVKSIRNRGSIALSLFWLVYAILLLVVGIMGKYKVVRVGGLALLLLAILKLFFVDLWSLGALYRIISSMSLGVVLLAISFAYQKYKDKFKEII